MDQTDQMEFDQTDSSFTEKHKVGNDQCVWY